MSLGHLSLRRKFTLAFLCCALFPLVVSATLMYVRTSAGLTSIQNRELADRVASVAAGIRQQQVTLTEPFVTSTDFTDAVVRRDRSATGDSLLSMLESLNLVQAQVLDTNGHMLGQVTVLPKAAALGSGVASVSFRTFLDKAWTVVSQAIYNGGERGKRVGTLVTVAQVDDEMLQSVSLLNGSPINLYIAGKLAASSAAGSTRVLVSSAAAGARRQTPGWTTAYSSLRDGAGRAVAVVAVSVPDAAFASTRSSVVEALELALGLALVTALLATVLLSHAVTLPLQALSRAARAIIKGEMRQHIDVHGKDEVSVVASAFNDMAESVAQTFEGLSDQIQVLSRGLADLSLVGETLAQSTDVEAELLPVAARVKTMTNSEFCSVQVFDGQRGAPPVYAGDAGRSARAVEEFAGKAVDARQAVSTVDLANDGRISKAARHTAGDISSVMTMPIVHQGRSVGMVTVGSRELRQYSYRTAAILSTVASQVATAVRHAETFKELERSYLQTVTALAAALEIKDEYTAGHAESIARTAVAVGRELGLPEQHLRQLEFAALLHDIGKIGVPAHILEKPGSLSEEEFAIIRQHTELGERIVSRIEYLRPLAPIIRAAHERWDGVGYPDRTAGDAIPLESRIILTCDAFDAMTSDRPYRETLTEAQALDELRANASSQFDPAVVDAFLKAYEARGKVSSLAEAASLADRRRAEAQNAAADPRERPDEPGREKRGPRPFAAPGSAG